MRLIERLDAPASGSATIGGKRYSAAAARSRASAPPRLTAACCLTRSGDLHSAARQGLLVGTQEDGQGGQVRQNLILTDIGILRSAGVRESP
jgi:hypothetical protein